MSVITDSDPRPVAPEEPALEDCCGNGCDPCIFDIYQQQLARYRAELLEWEQRQKAADITGAPTAESTPS